MTKHQIMPEKTPVLYIHFVLFFHRYDSIVILSPSVKINQILAIGGGKEAQKTELDTQMINRFNWVFSNHMKEKVCFFSFMCVWLYVRLNLFAFCSKFVVLYLKYKYGRPVYYGIVTMARRDSSTIKSISNKNIAKRSYRKKSTQIETADYIEYQ